MTLRNKGRAERTLVTAYGRVTYSRTGLEPVGEESRRRLAELRGGRKGYVWPLDEALGADGLPLMMTVGAMCLVAREAVRARSFKEARDAVEERLAVSLSTSTVRKAALWVGGAVLAAELAAAEAARAERDARLDRRTVRRRKDDVLYVEADGAMVDIRGASGGSSWTECKVGIVFHARDVRQYVTKKGEVRRQITSKAACGHVGGYEDFMWRLYAVALRYDCRRCAHVVFVSDGAGWLHTMAQRLFPGCTHVLDLAHAKEHVGRFGRWAFDGAEADAWIGETCRMVEEGRVEELLERLSPWEGASVPQEVGNLHTYVRNHADMMRYDTYSERGWFLGSGAIESSNRYLMQDRLKLPGMRWDAECAERMLCLKCLYETCRWGEVEPIVSAAVDALVAVRETAGADS